MEEQKNITSLKTFSPPVLTKCTECGLNFNFVNKHLDKNIYCQCVIPWLLPQNVETKFNQLNFTKNMDLPEDSTYFQERVFSDDLYGVFCKLPQPSVSPAAPHPGKVLLEASEIRKNKGNDDSISSKPVLKKQKTNIYASINAFHDAEKNKGFLWILGRIVSNVMPLDFLQADEAYERLQFIL
jgi:hypothetical protein